MNLGTLLFSFSGRINRAKYWAFTLLLLVVLIAVFSVVLFVPTMFTFIVFLVALVPIVVAGLAIGIRRLHDRDKSGWWILLFYWLPGAAWLLYAVAFALSAWGFVELGCLRGTAGPNRFGPDPLATSGAKLS
jgi:uncharacterized membrane protein YhaH (DUF805 family)